LSLKGLRKYFIVSDQFVSMNVHEFISGSLDHGRIKSENGIILDDALLGNEFFSLILAPMNNIAEFLPIKGSLLPLLVEH